MSWLRALQVAEEVWFGVAQRRGPRHARFWRGGVEGFSAAIAVLYSLPASEVAKKLWFGVAQRFSAAITALYSLPASEVAEKLWFGWRSALAAIAVLCSLPASEVAEKLWFRVAQRFSAAMTASIPERLQPLRLEYIV